MARATAELHFLSEQRKHEQALSVQAPRNVCRFCGCTTERPCGDRCGWADTHHTVCTAQGCIDKLMPIAKEALSTFHGRKCACGRGKGRSYWFCQQCSFELPWVLSMLSATPTMPLHASVRYLEAKTYLQRFVWKKEHAMTLDSGLLLEAERVATGANAHKIRTAAQLYTNYVYLANETGRALYKRGAELWERKLRDLIAEERKAQRAVAAAAGRTA